MRHLLLPFLLLAPASQATPVLADTIHQVPANTQRVRHAARYRQGPEVYLGPLRRELERVQDTTESKLTCIQARARARARYRAQRICGRTLWQDSPTE